MLKTLKNDVHGPLKIAGDGAIPKGSILFQYRPQCVLIVTKCWLSGSNESFWWALIELLAGSFWPLRLDKDIVRQGNWILRNVESGVRGLTVTAYSPHDHVVPLAFRILTVGVAHKLNSTFSTISLDSSWWHSPSTASWRAQSTGLASIGSTSGFFSNLAVIPLVTPRPGLKTLGWHWIVLVNCICTSCGKPAPETRILHIGFQSSLTRESQFQFLPKRGGCEPLTTRSGTMSLWVCDFGTWIGQGTDQKLGHSALFWFVGGYWRVKVEFPWNACCKSPGI